MFTFRYALPLSLLAIGAGLALLVLAVRMWWRAVRPNPSAFLGATDPAEDFARGLRIVAEDGTWAAWTTGENRTARDVFDARTAELIVDPTLKPRDLVGIDEHTAPGTGSVADLLAARPSAALRTPAEESRLQDDWDAALTEAPAHDAEIEERRFFAVFRLRMDRAAEAFEVMPGVSRAAQWLAYEHDAVSVKCRHCQKALHEISGEFAALVERVMAEGTREMAIVR